MNPATLLFLGALHAPDLLGGQRLALAPAPAYFSATTTQLVHPMLLAQQTQAPAEPEEVTVDREAYEQARRASRYVLRNRRSTLRTHRAFALAAWGTMLVTEVLGTVQALNQDTWFGRGACASDPNAFLCRDSTLVTGLHETFAFATVGLYTTAGVLAVAAPDPERESVGDDEHARTLRLHKAMGWVHAAGMILLPILGIASVRPQMFGVTSDEGRADFARAMRSLHTVVGYTTFAALSFSAYLELF